MLEYRGYTDDKLTVTKTFRTCSIRQSVIHRFTKSTISFFRYSKAIAIISPYVKSKFYRERVDFEYKAGI